MLDPKLIIYLIAGIGACGLSLIATPFVRSVALHLGFVDKPDGRRKTHKTAVALGGGAAVLLAMIGALGLVFFYSTLSGVTLLKPGNTFPLICLAVGAIVIVSLGLLDDFVGLRGRQKLLGQAAVVSLLIYAGVTIEGFTAFGRNIDLAWFAIPASAFWLIGTTNAVNLIDGIDGLAGSVGFILSLTMAAICGWQGNVAETAIMLALAGAQLGFLRYNFAPATIYLGDAGSMLIGLMCGTIAVMANAKSSAAMAFAVPIAVWSIPILDSFAALLRRKLTGRSLFTPDRGHMHHSLLTRGWTVRQASMFIALISATTCLSAVLSIYLKDERIALVTVVGVMIFLVYTKTFGHIEFALVSGRMRNLANSLVPSESPDSTKLQGSCVQLQGSREWGKLWAAIVEAADSYKLLKIKLTIDMPAIHESFYASWDSSRSDRPESTHIWRVSHPLMIEGDLVGHIDISGASQTDKKESTQSQIVAALEFLEPLEGDIRHIREQIETDPQDDLAAQETLLGTHPPQMLQAGPAADSASPNLPVGN